MMFAFLTPPMMMFLGVLGVLIFGSRMPELGRTLGQTMFSNSKRE